MKLIQKLVKSASLLRNRLLPQHILDINCATEKAMTTSGLTQRPGFNPYINKSPTKIKEVNLAEYY